MPTNPRLSYTQKLLLKHFKPSSTDHPPFPGDFRGEIDAKLHGIKGVSFQPPVNQPLKKHQEENLIGWLRVEVDARQIWGSNQSDSFALVAMPGGGIGIEERGYDKILPLLQLESWEQLIAFSQEQSAVTIEKRAGREARATKSAMVKKLLLAAVESQISSWAVQEKFKYTVEKMDTKMVFHIIRTTYTLRLAVPYTKVETVLPSLLETIRQVETLAKQGCTLKILRAGNY